VNLKQLRRKKMIKSYLKTMLPACLVIFWVAGCNGNGNGNGEDADADADVQPDPVPDEVTPDPQPDEITPDPTDEDIDEDPSEDPTEEEPFECPADDPPTHVYIDISGAVNSLDGISSVDGLYIAGISPMDALTNPVPTPIDRSTGLIGADGLFAFTCVDVGEVTLGLVMLTDDDPGGTDDNFYPTGTGVKSWVNPIDKVNVENAVVFPVPNTLLAGIETLASVDADTNGLAMGVIVDDATGAFIDGAEVVKADATALNVAYPTADFSGLEADGNTSANGVFVIQDALTGITNITVNATGYTFDDDMAATKAGFIYFLVLTGTAG